MSKEELKEAIRELKHYISITPHWKLKEYTFSEVDYYIKITLNYIDELQKENEEPKPETKIKIIIENLDKGE